MLYEVRGQDSGSFKFVPLAQMPSSLVQAVIAIEDRDFYAHGGISLKAITRAAWQNITSGEIISGGSTLTQQAVRNRLHPTRRTFLYKIKEAFLALKLEQALSKEEILESYLNTSYFGHQAYGIAAAAKIYFGKSPQELSLAESAMLAGVLQSPSSLDPFVNMKRAKERQKRVLDAMREVHPEIAYDEALQEPITLTKNRIAIRAPHFVMHVQERSPASFEQAGHLRTTLDLDLQADIEAIVRRKLEELKDKNVTSSAVVVLDAKTGDVLSMVGSADYFDTEHDGAVNVALSSRQPGSTIKPFTYALALMRGETAATTIADVETQFFTEEGNPYTPRNYDYGEHGLVRYREALANSYNIAAVKVAEKVGVPALLSFLKSAGIGTFTQAPDHYGLALTLGDAEVTLLDLTAAYGMFARGGVTLVPRMMAADPVQAGTRVLDAKVAWLISDILSDNQARLPEFGEDGPLSFGVPVAAKTGTTRNSRDNWTIGYSADVVVGVWVGNADNSPMRGTSGVTGAGPIFHDVMVTALKRYPPASFAQPSGIVRQQICRMSGKLPTPDCPQSIFEFFVAGTEPKEKDDLFRAVIIDTRNGLLASATCDPQFTKRQVFAVFPPEVKTWARESGWPSVPTAESPLCAGKEGIEGKERQESSKSSIPSLHSLPALPSFVHILSPQPNDSFKLDILIPDEHEFVIFKAQASDEITTIDWFVDGKKVGTGSAPDFRFAWRPIRGTHRIEAKNGQYTDARSIEIVE